MSITFKLILSGILLLILLVAGIYIHRTGKPYNVAVFTVHKLFTLAMIALVTIVLIQLFRQTGLSMGMILLTAFLGIATFALLASGGLLSLDKIQIGMLWVHRLSTAVFIICYILLIYRIIFSSIQTTTP